MFLKCSKNFITFDLAHAQSLGANWTFYLRRFDSLLFEVEIAKSGKSPYRDSWTFKFHMSNEDFFDET